MRRSRAAPLVLLLLLSGCRVHLGEPLPAATDKPTIVILKTDDLPEWDEPSTAFAEASGRATVTISLSRYGIHDLGQSRQWGYAAELALQLRERYHPPLVFALGTQATRVARELMGGVPVVFAGSVAWEALELGGGHVTGISMEIPPATLLTQFKLVVPKVRRIGVVYDPDYRGGDVRRARAVAERLKLELVEAPVRGPEGFADRLAELDGKVDALWLPGDPSSMTRDNVDLAIRFSSARKLPTLVQRAELVPRGFLMSVSLNAKTVGSQAATIANTILTDGTPAARLPVAAPIGTYLVTSACTAARLSLPLDEDVLGVSDRIVECTEK